MAPPGLRKRFASADWDQPPPNANMLAFGNLGVEGGSLSVQGWLFDVKNSQSPQVLGKQYREEANDANARIIAHRFADEIIFRLGGGIPGIAESRSISSATVPDKGSLGDGLRRRQPEANHAQRSIALSPHVSPDGTRIAYAGVTKEGWQIQMWSLELGRNVSFPALQRDESVAGVVIRRQVKLAFSSSYTGHSNLFLDRQQRRQSAPPDQRQRTGRFTDLESKNQRANRVRQWTHRPAADLHHGI